MVHHINWIYYFANRALQSFEATVQYIKYLQLLSFGRIYAANRILPLR